MIPRVCPETASPGEKEFFRRLRDDPDTRGWTVLHSLDLAKHVDQVSGEADFVILVPGAGILVVEVKSHKSIHVDDEGWHMGVDPKVDRKGPFKQASSAMHSVREYLEACDPSYASILAWSAVAFPRAPFRTKSPEWHDWQVIDQARLSSAPISRIVPLILRQGAKLLEGAGVKAATCQDLHASPERCASVARALRPKFEIALSPKTARRELDDELIRLTEEQFSALDQTILNQRIVFSGAAGTGKTVLAMEALRRACTQGSPHEVALFCYNTFLGEQLSERAKVICPGATVGTIDAWLTGLARGHVTNADRSSSTYWKGGLAEIAMDQLFKGNTDAPFRTIIVDEAQDLFQSHYLDVLDLVIRGGLAGGSWMMFGDFLGQDIFSKRVLTLEGFVQARCPSAARFLLNTNCRNTTPISEYVVTLGRLDPPYTKVLRGEGTNEPVLTFWRDPEDQKRKVSDFLKQCLDPKSGFKPRDIVLLSPRDDNSLGQQMALDPEWSGRVAPWASGADKIRYSTIQSFKGLEAPVVIVTDFDSVESDLHQSLFYIGLSRAQHHLGIFLQQELKAVISSIIR